MPPHIAAPTPIPTRRGQEEGESEESKRMHEVDDAGEHEKKETKTTMGKANAEKQHKKDSRLRRLSQDSRVIEWDYIDSGR